MSKSSLILGFALLAALAGAILQSPVLSLEPAVKPSQSLAPSMTSLLHVDPGKLSPAQVNIIVEIPRGSQNKYEFDAEQGVMKLDRVLASPFHYPGEYGFVPRSVNADGDPLDVMVLSTAPTYPGVMIAVRPIGMLEKVDGRDRDELILAVPIKDPRFAKVRTLDDVPEAVRNEVAHFFSVYKTLENKTVSVTGWKGDSEARATISRCQQAFAAAGK